MIYKQKKKKTNSCQGQPVQTRTHKARLFRLGPLLPYLTPEDSAESITSSGRRAQRPAVPCGLWLWAPHCRPCCLGPCPVGAEAPSRVPSSRWNLLKEKFLNAETQPPWGIGVHTTGSFPGVAESDPACPIAHLSHRQAFWRIPGRRLCPHPSGSLPVNNKCVFKTQDPPRGGLTGLGRFPLLLWRAGKSPGGLCGRSVALWLPESLSRFIWGLEKPI